MIRISMIVRTACTAARGTLRGALAALMVATVAGAARAQDDDARPLFRRATSGAPATGPRSVEVRIDAATMASLRVADRARVTLPASGDRTLELELVARDVRAPGARILQTGARGAEPTALDVRLFHGRTHGDATGWVVLSVSRSGVLAVIQRPTERLVVVPRDGAGLDGPYVVADAADLPDAGRAFECRADELATSLPELPRRRSGAGAESEGAIVATADRHVCDLAVECDYEFFTDQGSDVEQALSYAATLVGVVSAIYENDFNVSVRVSYLNVWTIPEDPYTQNNTETQLTQFTNYWNATHGDVSRHLAHLLSGRSLGGGIASLDVLCNRPNGYGVSQVDGVYTYPTASATWDAYVLSHELGHNFGSFHTQSCTWQTLGLTPVGTLLDSCYTPEGGCYSGPLGVVPTGGGTIMSYCHLLGPIASTIRLQLHPACVTVMRARAEACLPVSAFDAQLAVTATSAGFDVTLSWDPSPAPGVLHYDVYRAGTPLTGNPTLIGSTPGTQWIDRGRIGPGFYRVRAVRAGDVSGFSVEVHADPCPPQAGTFAAGTTTLAPILADVNADGIDDVLVANGNTSGTVTLLLGIGADGVGNGTFTSPVPFPAGSKPSGMVAADVNDDAILDLMLSNNELSGTFSVLLGTGEAGVGDGGFAAPVTYAVGVRPSAIATGDFNEDGAVDVAVANLGNNSVSVALGQTSAPGLATGTFAATTLYGVGTRPIALVPGDFDADGITDLAVLNSGSASSAILFGQGDGGVGTGAFAVASLPALNNGGGLARGDFNADGITDLALTQNLANGTVGILIGQGAAGTGNGTFAAPVTYPAGAHPTAILVADYDEDGVSDLAVTQSTGSQVAFLRGNGAFAAGDGTFGAPQMISVGTQPAGLALRDLDEDGRADLVAASTASLGNVAVRRWSCASGGVPAPQLVTPNGGESWPAGTEHAVTWTKDPRVRSVDVDLSRDGGTTWERLVSDHTGTAFAWTVTEPMTGTPAARVRVRDSAVPDRMDVSDAPFTVAQNPLVGVGEPTVPELAIRRIYPNPSTAADLTVRFVLPSAGTARVELYDAAGRRVRGREVAAPGAGEHQIRLGAGGTLRSGVYWVRLTHRGLRKMAKVAIMG